MIEQAIDIWVLKIVIRSHFIAMLIGTTVFGFLLGPWAIKTHDLNQTNNIRYGIHLKEGAFNQINHQETKKEGQIVMLGKGNIYFSFGQLGHTQTF